MVLMAAPPKAALTAGSAASKAKFPSAGLAWLHAAHVRRVPNDARPDSQTLVKSQGLVYADTEQPDGSITPYWFEEVRYEFGLGEIETLYDAAAELYDMHVAALEHVIEYDRFWDIGVPDFAIEPLLETWRRNDPSVLGRFDMAYNGTGPAKLLEFNASNAAMILESAYIQWEWLVDLQRKHRSFSQWNRLHDELLDRYRVLAPAIKAAGPLHLAFTSTEVEGEAAMNMAYLQQVAAHAGIDTKLVPIEQLRWTDEEGYVDHDAKKIMSLQALYKWDWILLDQGPASKALRSTELGSTFTRWLSPLWKWTFDSKAMLALLWELFPDHPNLLPTTWGEADPALGPSYVRKPFWGFEGANIEVVLDGKVAASTGGEYENTPYVCQQFVELGRPEFGGALPVLGVWMVDDRPAGLCVREQDDLITDHYARFVPHVVV